MNDTYKRACRKLIKIFRHSWWSLSMRRGFLTDKDLCECQNVSIFCVLFYSLSSRGLLMFFGKLSTLFLFLKFKKDEHCKQLPRKGFCIAV